MATYTLTDTNTILRRFVFEFDLDDKTAFRKPARKLIPSRRPVFNNSKKNRRHGVHPMISKKTTSSSLGETTDIVGINEADLSNDVMPSVNGKRIITFWRGRLYSWLIPVILISASVLINSGAFLMLIVIATIALSFLKLLLQIPPINWKRQQHQISMVSDQKCLVKFDEPSLRTHLGERKMQIKRNTTSLGLAWKWIVEFFQPTDIQDIEVFCFIIAILLAFELLSQLYCYISRMLFPKNDTE